MDCVRTFLKSPRCSRETPDGSGKAPTSATRQLQDSPKMARRPRQRFSSSSGIPAARESKQQVPGNSGIQAISSSQLSSPMSSTQLRNAAMSHQLRNPSGKFPSVQESKQQVPCNSGSQAVSSRCERFVSAYTVYEPHSYRCQ